MKYLIPLLSVALVLALPYRSAFGAEKNQHNFDKWEKEISAYEKADATNPPPKGAILFIGSSTVRMWKTLAQDWPDMAQGADGKPRSELFLKDQLHFNADGYKLLADRVRPDLERYSKAK
jgi:lysophospholipase L1-like esterase